MKDKLLIVFCSKYGYSKRYVDIIGNAVGCDAVPADKFKPEMTVAYDKILYIGSVRNGLISGFGKFSEHLGAIYKKTVICAVGYMPFRTHIPMQLKETSLPVTYEKFLPVFYAQGGLDLNELGRLDKMQISLVLRQVKMKEVPTDAEQFLLGIEQHPVDEVKQANIQPLIDYLEGKRVDEKLYSPPEITDPEEERLFFEELEEAGKYNGESKKRRELKRKLKK